MGHQCALLGTLLGLLSLNLHQSGLLGFHPHPTSDLTPEPWPLSLPIPFAGVEYPDCLNCTEL